MQDAHAFLKALTIVLGVAAVTTVVFQRLRQPVVLGYIMAGLIVGPHVPIPLVADSAVVQTLSELGVILLMFSLGLEFSIRKLAQVGPTAGLTAVLQSSIMVWLGFMVGQLFGWTTLESLFAGAIIAISSTTIIAKAFDEQAVTGRLREIVVGILIVEDLIAILLMAILTAIASGSGLSAGPLAATIGRLAAFLVGLVAAGMLLVPRVVRAINRLKRRETTLVASIGLCFAVALLAQAFGYSVALGAFIAGSLVAESGEEQQVVRLVEPVRDVFAAIFFVSVGMQIDPALVARHWLAVAVLTTVVVLGKVFGVSLGAFLTGAGMRTSAQGSSPSSSPLSGSPCRRHASSSTRWRSPSRPSRPSSHPGGFARRSGWRRTWIGNCRGPCKRSRPCTAAGSRNCALPRARTRPWAASGGSFGCWSSTGRRWQASSSGRPPPWKPWSPSLGIRQEFRPRWRGPWSSPRRSRSRRRFASG